MDVGGVQRLLAAGADPLETCPVVQSRKRQLGLVEVFLGILVPPLGVFMLANPGQEQHTVHVLPLTMAVTRRSSGAVDALLAAGASPLDLDPQGRRPLRAALAVDLPTGEARWTHRLLGPLPVPPDFLCSDPRSLDLLRDNPALRKRLERAGMAGGGQDCEGQTWLHRAAGRSIADTRAVLDEDVVPVDARDDRGRTALWVAAEAGHWDTADLLRARGATVEGAGGSAGSLLHLAAADGQAERVEELLAAGLPAAAPSEQGDTPLVRAVEGGHREIAARLLAAGGLPDPAGGLAGEMLHASARQGDAELLEMLLAAGAPVDAMGVFHRTALDLAWRKDHLEAARVLVAHGARPGGNPEGRRPDWDPAPLAAALLAGRSDWVALLLPVATDAEREAALAGVVRAGDRSAAAALLRPGLDLSRVLMAAAADADADADAVRWLRDQGARFPPEALQTLAAEAATEVLAQALEDGAWPDAPDADGVRPIEHALRADRLDGVALLASHGAPLGQAGTRALDAAVFSGGIERALELIRLGAVAAPTTWSHALRLEDPRVLEALLTTQPPGRLGRWRLRRAARRRGAAPAIQSLLDAAPPTG